MYASQTDLITRYGEDEIIALSDHAQEGSMDDDVVDAALNDASLEMDAYLSNSYTLPLTAPYPALLVKLCSELARYILYKDKATETVRKGREDAIALLRRIASGEATLQLSANTPATDDMGTSFQVQTSSRVFSDTMFLTMPGVASWI
jgi:phage gp36-like protein